MVPLLLVPTVVVEDGLHTRRGELVAQGRGLLATELAVVGAPHLVAPPVTLGLGQLHVALAQRLHEPGPVDRARVHQCIHDLVAEGLLEPASGERIPSQVPVRLRRLR